MPMTGASMFWLDNLHDCKLDRSLPLPYDRYRLSNEHRTGRGTSVSFDFGQHLSHAFLIYALSKKIEPQHLALAIYFVFLFKLTNGERDLCIGMNVDNRYRDELKSVIGLFENIIPSRCQLDPHWSFAQMGERVRETIADSMKYSYFPLQRILEQHQKAIKPAFLDIFFDFQSNNTENSKNEVVLGNPRLHPMSNSISRNKYGIMDTFDFSVLIEHDLNVNQLSCTINASLDLYNVETIDKIAQQYHAMLHELFSEKGVQIKTPIYEVSFILPDERLLLQSINNTQISGSSVTCIHHEFVCRVMKHPQKLAVELDDQCLTYCELLNYVQVLSLHLMNKYHVIPGEIICQCVERSVSMVNSLRQVSFINCNSSECHFSLGYRYANNRNAWWCLLSTISP
jgi:fengycin family lipopeptide synthetase D